MFTHLRRGLLAAVPTLLATLVVLVPAHSAGAADSYQLVPGWVVLDATVTCPGSPDRQLDGPHAAAFIESWYFATITATILEETPPAGLPRCTFVARERISDAPFQFRAFYVVQGNKAWLGLPPQEIGPSAFVPEQKWYISHQRAKDAFLGKVLPLALENPTTTTTAPTTTRPAAAADDDDSSDNTAAWIIVAVAGVALLSVIVIVVRRRAGTSPAGE